MSNSASESGHLPVDNPTEPFWLSELHELHNHRSTQSLPESCDVVVIGAGYAGVSTAYNIVKDDADTGNSKLSVTILEARGACSGATGRNGGHVRPSFGEGPIYIQRYGPEAAEELARYEFSHLQIIKKLIEKEKLDCEFTLTRTCSVFTKQNVADQAESVYNGLVRAGLTYMDDVQFISGQAAEGVSGVQGAKACMTYTSGTIWPYKFIMQLLSSALKTGLLNLQTYTPATAITTLPSGDFLVETPRGSIHAKTVVHANNAYVAGLLPEYSASIIPCKGICCRIKVPEGVTAPLITNSYVIFTPDGNGLDYFIPRSDGSIIVGGASHTFRSSKEQWYNNTDDSTLITAAEDYYNGYMQRTFRGWENTDAKVENIWSGIMGYSFDTLPHVGHVPDRLGQLVVAGFNGHGMPVIWLAAKGIAEMIRSGKSFEEVGLPRLIKTTSSRIENAQKGPEGGDIFLLGD